MDWQWLYSAAATGIGFVGLAVLVGWNARTWEWRLSMIAVAGCTWLLVTGIWVGVS